MSKRKLTIEEVKERLKKAHGDVVMLDESTYVNTHTKCRLIDRDYGEWWAAPGKILFGQSHPKRGRICQKKSVTLSINIIKKRIHKIHGDILTLDDTTYKNIDTKARFIDKKYGEWWARPANIIYLKYKHPKRGRVMRSERCSVSIIEINKMIYNIHVNNIVLDDTTYKNMHTKARFIDKKYGEWWTRPYYVINGSGHPMGAVEKRRQTNLKKHGVEWALQNKNIKEKRKQNNLTKYGVESPMQNPEIALKVAKAQNNSFILTHWYSHEEIVCVASYEKKTVEYFNKNKIDYNWQVQTFLMPNGKTFRPDCYLPDENKWIEIKGYFREDAQEKWEWFHKEYPNSELWDKKKLKEMKIL